MQKEWPFKMQKAAVQVAYQCKNLMPAQAIVCIKDRAID